LINGKTKLEKYSGVKQVAAKEKVAKQREVERAKRTFSK
jgi:hypothetical protein